MNAPYWWGWGVVGGVGGGGGGMGFNRNSLSDGSYDATYKKIQSIFNISYSEDPDFFLCDFEPKNWIDQQNLRIKSLFPKWFGLQFVFL